MRTASCCTLFFVGLWFVLSGGGALAQDLTGGMQTQGTSYHVFARPGQNTVQVMVLGSGVQPGLYELGEGTDLSQLVALGGFGPGARQSNNRRSITIELYRDNAAGQRERVYVSDFDDFLQRRTDYPVLQMGDVVRVEIVERERFSWRDALQVVTAAASLTLAIERISRAF